MRRVALTLVTVAGLIGCAEHAIDAEMERLCKLDGGLTVFETVLLPPDMFDKYGQPTFFKVGDGILFEEQLGPDFRQTFELKEILQIRGVDLNRQEWKIFRRNGMKLLGQSVKYSSVKGWSRVPLAEGGRSGCPAEGAPVPNLMKSIFIQK